MAVVPSRSEDTQTLRFVQWNCFSVVAGPHRSLQPNADVIAQTRICSDLDQLEHLICWLSTAYRQPDAREGGAVRESSVPAGETSDHSTQIAVPLKAIIAGIWI
jgi:hypothetical protein